LEPLAHKQEHTQPEPRSSCKLGHKLEHMERHSSWEPEHTPVHKLLVLRSSQPQVHKREHMEPHSS